MMEFNKRINLVKYTLTPDQIMSWVGGLHDIQADMIEEALAGKGFLGYPEANQIINHIRGLK